MGVEMKLLDVQSQSRDDLMAIRSQDRIIQSERFTEAWEKATKKQRYDIQTILDLPDPEKLKDWIKEVCSEGFYAFSMRKLRAIASYYRIPRYSRLTKEALIQELHKHENQNTARGNVANPTTCGRTEESIEHKDGVSKTRHISESV